jgi:hypothetical protein
VPNPIESALRTGGSLSVAVIRPVARGMSDAAIAGVDAVLDSRLAAEVVDRVAASPLVGRALGAALEGPLLDVLARDLVRYRVAERLLSDGLVEQTTTRVLESEELWLLVEEIARSPAVTDAIARQSVGFADVVAGGVRARSRSADTWLEQRARRVLRRRPAPADEAVPPPDVVPPPDGVPPPDAAPP